MPKRPAASDGAISGSTGKKKSKSMKAAGGFRDKMKAKSGVINYLFKPKDASAYNYGELEVEKEWPARPVHQVKIPPSGSPDYQPGQSVVSFCKLIRFYNGSNKRNILFSTSRSSCRPIAT